MWLQCEAKWLWVSACDWQGQLWQSPAGTTQVWLQALRRKSTVQEAHSAPERDATHHVRAQRAHEKPTPPLSCGPSLQLPNPRQTLFCVGLCQWWRGNFLRLTRDDVLLSKCATPKVFFLNALVNCIGILLQLLQY